ncbi:MAG: Asp-tRNA(Asn)/Glu-tRNA(Gln) amidotransferase GatCAB subunit B, partial [Bdellovibrionaceae bacterium]|nr:Asp-tRNA(Asn)/Glu-tRNA(Gln) amidotransferase GatCAB subunit B [Pseudobdellovibrionaceae bacterium]
EQKELKDCPIPPQHLGAMIKKIDDGTISGKMGKTLFAHLWKTGQSPEQAIKELGLVQIQDDGAILSIIDQVLSQNPDAVTEYRSGKTKSFGFLVGQIMKASKGQANPQKVNELLKKRLEQA